MIIADSALKKKLWNKQFYIILATNTIQSCIEAAEELFQHTFGHKSMKHVNAYFYIYIYMCIAYSALKKNADFLLVPDIICSCIEAVDEMFQGTLGYDCIEHDVNTISVCVCMTIVYSTQKKREFHYFCCRYYLQLHWSCWRTVPAHLGSWMHGTSYQYYYYMCIYVYSLICFKTKFFIISAADTICSCIEAVDEQFQYILGSECM